MDEETTRGNLWRLGIWIYECNRQSLSKRKDFCVFASKHVDRQLSTLMFFRLLTSSLEISGSWGCMPQLDLTKKARNPKNKKIKMAN